MAERDSSAKSAGYMREDLSVIGIGVGVAAIFAAIVFALVAAYTAIHLSSPGSGTPRLAARIGGPPPIESSVVLEARPAQDIGALMADKRTLIESYGWVDRDRGVARIPIERAMAIIAAGTPSPRGAGAK